MQERMQKSVSVPQVFTPYWIMLEDMAWEQRTSVSEIVNSLVKAYIEINEDNLKIVAVNHKGIILRFSSSEWKGICSKQGVSREEAIEEVLLQQRRELLQKSKS